MNINIENRRKIYKARRFGDENNYRALYRFSRENVEWLADHFLPDYDERRGGALNKIMQMQAFLRYIGDPGFQVSFSSINRIIAYILKRPVEFSNEKRRHSEYYNYFK